MERKWPAMAGAKINLSLHVLSSCFHKTGSKLCISRNIVLFRAVNTAKNASNYNYRLV